MLRERGSGGSWEASLKLSEVIVASSFSFVYTSPSDKFHHLQIGCQAPPGHFADNSRSSYAFNIVGRVMDESAMANQYQVLEELGSL